MAKLFITDSTSGERIPFLRGVLVESLARTGLSFQDAYVLAQSIRDSLGNESEIAIETLKQRVSAELKEQFGASLAESYNLGSSQEREIMVRTENEEVPFSAGILSRSLQACAIDRADALETAKQIHEHLRRGDASVIDHLDLRQIIHDQLERARLEICCQSFSLLGAFQGQRSASDRARWWHNGHWKEHADD